MNGPDDVVFLVDDDEGVRKALARVLHEEGFEVQAFESAEAFLSRPVGDAGSARTDAGGPCATMRPPPRPPLGPRSTR